GAVPARAAGARGAGPPDPHGQLSGPAASPRLARGATAKLRLALLGASFAVLLLVGIAGPTGAQPGLHPPHARPRPPRMGTRRAGLAPHVRGGLRAARHGIPPGRRRRRRGPATSARARPLLAGAPPARGRRAGGPAGAA